MRTETVRVVNPARPDTFMTINRAEFGSGHDLWPEQGEGFVPPLLPSQPFDPAERQLAAEILSRLVCARYNLSQAEWLGLSGPARLDCLRAFEIDVAQPAAALAGPSALTVAKVSGPRGLWYVMQGDRRVSQGFRTEAEAQAEHERMGA